jgi:hypothetical protein
MVVNQEYKNGMSNDNKPRTIEDSLSQLTNEKLMGNFDDIYKMMPLTADTSCGISFLRGPILQKYVNKDEK